MFCYHIFFFCVSFSPSFMNFFAFVCAGENTRTFFESGVFRTPQHRHMDTYTWTDGRGRLRPVWTSANFDFGQFDFGRVDFGQFRLRQVAEVECPRTELSNIMCKFNTHVGRFLLCARTPRCMLPHFCPTPLDEYALNHFLLYALFLSNFNFQLFWAFFEVSETQQPNS